MFENFLDQCVYVAIFLGTLLEGELSLISSSLGAKLGYYNFYVAMFLAFAGAWVADWFKYLVAKTKGQMLLNKKPKLKAKVEKYTKLFESHPFLALTVYKFFFGFTTVILIIAGLRDVSYFRFALHSGISVAMWTALLGGTGYFCAEVMLENIKMMSVYKKEILIGLAVLVFLIWFFVKRPYRKYCLTCK